MRYQVPYEVPGPILGPIIRVGLENILKSKKEHAGRHLITINDIRFDLKFGDRYTSDLIYEDLNDALVKDDEEILGKYLALLRSINNYITDNPTITAMSVISW